MDQFQKAELENYCNELKDHFDDDLNRCNNSVDIVKFGSNSFDSLEKDLNRYLKEFKNDSDKNIVS